MGIEPTTTAWEAAILPLNYTCNDTIVTNIIVSMQGHNCQVFCVKYSIFAKKYFQI